MTMTSVNIDSAAMGELIGAAVMQTVTAEQRDTLIKAAISHLLDPERNSYGSSQSPLQRTFNQAVERYARTYVDAQLESDTDFAINLKGVITDAVEKVFTADRERLVDKVAEAISGAFGPRY